MAFEGYCVFGLSISGRKKVSNGVIVVVRQLTTFMLAQKHHSAVIDQELTIRKTPRMTSSILRIMLSRNGDVIIKDLSFQQP